MRLWLAFLFVFDAVSPAWAQSRDDLRVYLADAIRLVGECPAVKLDVQVAALVARIAGINDAQAQMRALGEQQLALSDTVKPPVPLSPGAMVKPPTDPPHPSREPVACRQALEFYGPAGARLAGLVVSRD